MPFRFGFIHQLGGVPPYHVQNNTYCQTDTSASDYGRCYNVTGGRVVFVQTDTTNYPTLPCESDNICTRFTTTVAQRTLTTLADLTGVGKQLILKQVSATSHASVFHDGRTSAYLRGLILPTVDSHAVAYYLPSKQFLPFSTGSTCVYNPVYNATYCYNRYTITVGAVQEFWMDNNIMGQRITLSIYEDSRNNIYYAYFVQINYMHEASPIAIIPLDYDEYSKYQELRKVFGYNLNGIDQPGWNASDIIRILSEIFPDRVWMVFDDSDLTLYGYGITLEQVPAWLVSMLNPISFKILREPWDLSLVERFISELEARNYYVEQSS